jgi:tRNA(Ile)-lysidine synthase
MPRSSGLFLRPFLGLGKSLLLEYLSESDLKYSTDSTNASGEFLRNRVRRGLIPALDAAMPGWRKGLCLAADKASSDEEALGSMSEAMAFRGTGPGEVETRAEALLSASGAVAERAIVSAAGALLGRPRFPHAAARAALAALRGTGSRRYLGAGLEILVRDGSVIMRRGLDFPRRGGYFVLIDRPLRVRVGAVEVIAAWRERGRSGIRADAFSFPLVVRSRRPGDAIASRCGTKRLDALFSEWGISAAFRGRAPVVEDRDGIVAVLGASLGGKDRFRWRPGIEISEGASMPLLSVIVKGA